MTFNTAKRNKLFMLSHVNSLRHLKQFIYVMITQMYVQGHRGDTNPAVSTVPPTGSQYKGLYRNIKLRAFVCGGNVIHATLWL